MRINRLWLGLAILLLLVFTSRPVYSAYIEGVDTTDIDGFSRDSAFRVYISRIYMNAGFQMISLGSKHNASEYYNYKFDEINKAPAKFMFSNGFYQLNFNSCFVVQRSKDSTYLKFTVLERLSDGRYLYRFGLNTEPNGLLLINSDYDKSVRYKPNNFHRRFRYGVSDSLYWEPPIPNNNHLIGYIVYMAKLSVKIDTTVPINMAQWDSIAFTDTIFLRGSFNTGRYINIVAVYTEGRSNFLQGWNIFETELGIVPSAKSSQALNTLSVSKVPEGLLFDFKSQNPLSAAIFDPSGRQLATFTNIFNNRLLWLDSGNKPVPGFYVLRAVLPDKSMISQSFIIK